MILELNEPEVAGLLCIGSVIIISKAFLMGCGDGGSTVGCILMLNFCNRFLMDRELVRMCHMNLIDYEPRLSFPRVLL